MPSKKPAAHHKKGAESGKRASAPRTPHLPAPLDLFLLLLSAVAAIMLLWQSGGLGSLLDPSPGGQSVVKGELTVHYIDVGQGDAALVVSPEGNAMLIDAGPGASASDLLRYLEQQEIRHLDYAVFTHPHEDHIGGADDVLNAIPTDTVILSGGETDTATYERMLDAIESSGAALLDAAAGAEYTLGSASFTILGPLGNRYSNLNDWSVVLRLRYGSTTFLFAGDAEKKVEEELLEFYANARLNSTVFKASHHGSDTSNTEAFLEAVHPKYVVISVGKNNTYGHPVASVLERFAALGAEVHRTDEEGTVVLRSNGRTVTAPERDSEQKLPWLGAFSGKS